LLVEETLTVLIPSLGLAEGLQVHSSFGLSHY